MITKYSAMTISSGRSERMWISIETGRLRGLLTFTHQGYSTPFYRQNVVARMLGREVQSQNEYRELLKAITQEQQTQLNQAWAEYKFDSAIPKTLFQFADYREISPQAWFPFEVLSSGWSHNKANQQYYDFNLSVSRVTEFATDRSDLKSLWMPLLPKEGENIQDKRFAAVVDYEYRRDRTTAEIEALVSEQLFRFAKSQIRIDDLHGPLNRLLSKPAFDLPDDGWLGERPDLKGKPYMLHFWATWCGPCKNDVPILNAIAENSIVIGVHPSGTPDDEIRKSMADAKMTYPTIVAGGDKNSPLGYPTQMFPYCVQVDAHGKIAKHGFLHDVLGTPSPALLEKDVSTKSNVVGQVVAMKLEDGLFQLSLGTKDGIEPPQMLDVVRDGKRIGQLRVVLAKEHQCVGKSDRKEEVDGIKVGDRVQP